MFAENFYVIILRKNKSDGMLIPDAVYKTVFCAAFNDTT